jgi:hypothetical protein
MTRLLVAGSHAGTMNARRRLRRLLVLAVVCVVFGAPAQAQVSRDRLEGLCTRLQDLNQFFEGLTAEERRALSGSAQNLLQLARTGNALEEELERELPQLQQLQAPASHQQGRSASHGSAALLSGVAAVSDPG